MSQAVVFKLLAAADKPPKGYYKVRLFCTMCKDGGIYAMKYGTTINEAPCPKCWNPTLTIHVSM